MEGKEISSLQHPIIKYLAQLRTDKALRAENRSVLVSGIKLIQEISQTHRIKKLLLGDGYTPAVPIQSQETFIVSDAILKKVTALQNPEPIAAEIEILEDSNLFEKKSLLILDQISDPGNLGTLFRSALSLGWEGIFLTPGSTDPFNEKALRAARGATFKIPFKQGSYEELYTLLKENQMDLFIADVDGDAVDTLTPPPTLALVLGNEAHGANQDLKASGQAIKIPIQMMQSLNVTAAGAILMYLLKRP